MNAKKILVALALLGALPLAAAADVSKEDVKKLAKAGLSDDVILSFIRANGPMARLSADDIVELKEAGVSERVLAVLAGTPIPAPAPRTLVSDGENAYTPPSTTYVVQEPVVYTSYTSSPWYSSYWGWPYYWWYPYGYYGYYGYYGHGHCGYYPSHGSSHPSGYAGAYTGYRPYSYSGSGTIRTTPSSSGYRGVGYGSGGRPAATGVTPGGGRPSYAGSSGGGPRPSSSSRGYGSRGR
jgi:hypothetical protein